MNVLLLDLNGEKTEFINVDRVAYLNHESYGTAAKLRADIEDGEEAVLVVNINAIAALKLTL